MRLLAPLILLVSFTVELAVADKLRIDRKAVVQSFNPTRTESSPETPLQVGNGNFAFGVDITGLQTFGPFSTLSTWGWHNFSLPKTPGQTQVSDYHGTDWWTHGRLVNYNMVSPNESEIGNWLRENPHRINLARIGLVFGDQNITEAALSNKSQTLDMWTGILTSQFTYKEDLVTVKTASDPETDTLSIIVTSSLLSSGDIGVVFDLPYPVNQKFEAPSVGTFDSPEKHSSSLTQCAAGNRGTRARIVHDLDNTTYSLHLHWNSADKIARPDPDTHRYYLYPKSSDTLSLTIDFSETDRSHVSMDASKVQERSRDWWGSFWESGAFIDLTGSESEAAHELQRITVQSLYLEAVNIASDLPPQESGLVNNGWYGKFHMEMYGWHTFQFARWNHWPLYWRSANHTYQLLLDDALSRAKRQGYEGARWGKMTGSNLVDSPGEINTLLIWQQPHAMYFAELEYRQFPSLETLEKWDKVLSATADFIYSYGFWNESCYQLGPPMYPISENTQPNSTVNPTFELAYWRFGLEVASNWKKRQEKPVPTRYTEMLEKLCPLPVDNGTYPIYEGIPDMWIDNNTVTDHPGMAGIYGLLPPPSDRDALDLGVVRHTADRIHEVWDLPNSYGWDFPMMAMNSLRLGDVDRAIEYLLHHSFDFDDAGYPTGGTRVPRPYFPSSGSFLLAMAMMAGGWDGEEYPHFPEDWAVNVEGFTPAM
uniref:Six-hairpin glycosidase-like protein n=1 Tax=Bionectria ochroleuca TaxID=29856 RepID=A0A8H7TMZ7_BIOOC